MTDEGIERALGRLEGKMDLMGEQIATVHIKVDRIITDGCTKGQQNEHEITELKGRQNKTEGILRKAIAVGVLAAGGGAGTVKLLDLIF